MIPIPIPYNTKWLGLTALVLAAIGIILVALTYHFAIIAGLNARLEKTSAAQISAAGGIADHAATADVEGACILNPGPRAIE